MRGFIGNKLQQWVLCLKVTKDHVKVPQHESHSFPMPLLPLSPLPDSNLPAIFYGYIRKLITPTPCSGSLSISHHLLSLGILIDGMTLSLSLSYFLSFSVSSVFYSCCNSQLTFPSLWLLYNETTTPSPACPPPFSFFSNITFITPLQEKAQRRVTWNRGLRKDSICNVTKKDSFF